MTPNLLDQLECTSGTILTVEENGQIVAVLEYDWIKNATDMFRADHGKPVRGGQVLYVSNIKTLPGYPQAIWKLRAQLPPHRWIVGLTETLELRAPKGVPHDFLGNNLPMSI